MALIHSEYSNWQYTNRKFSEKVFFDAIKTAYSNSNYISRQWFRFGLKKKATTHA